MSAQQFVISAKRKLRQGDVAFNRVNSEAVQSKMAGSINFLLDQPSPALKFEIQGYVVTGDFTSTLAMYYVTEDSQVSAYNLILGQTGNLAGDIIVNVDVYDNNGLYVGPLFGETGANRILVNGNGNNAQRVVMARDYVANTSTTINAAGITTQFGEKDILTIPAGSVIVGRLASGVRRARYMNFSLFLEGV